MSTSNQINISAFVPTSIPFLSAWIDASQQGSFTLSPGTSNLATITDLAESTNYTIGGTAVTWAVNAFTSGNGLTYPGFNTTNGRLIRSLTNVCTQFQNTFFCVARRDNLTGDGFPLCSLATTTSGSGQFLRCMDNRDNSAGANASFRVIPFATNIYALSNANTTQPFLVYTSYNGNVTLDARIYYSGQQFYPWTFGGTAAQFTAGSNGNAFMIAADGFSGSQNYNAWPGIICEVLLYRNTVLDSFDRQRVEGYLAWKWGLQGSLPADHLYKNLPVIFGQCNAAPTAPPGFGSIPMFISFRSFNPLSISGSVIWLDAADPTVFTGGSTWIDKSGTGNNATAQASSATTMPTVTSINGLRAAQFLIANKTGIFTTNNISQWSVTYFIVCRITGVQGGPVQMFLFINNIDGQRQLQVYNPSAPANTFPTSVYYVTNSSVASDLVSSSIAQNQLFMVVCTVPSSSSGTAYSYLNGALSPTTTRTTIANTSQATQCFIGAPPNAGSDQRFVSFDLAEFLIYGSELSTDNRRLIEGYLAWKWRIQNVLPVAHPYYLFPPPP